MMNQKVASESRLQKNLLPVIVEKMPLVAVEPACKQGFVAADYGIGRVKCPRLSLT